MKRRILLVFVLCVVLAQITGCGDASSADEMEIDIDLTEMSDTIMIAAITDVYTNASENMGKVIKMKGQCFRSSFPETNQYYHNVLTYDGGACCAYGFEFILGEEYANPDDYPKDGARIEVTGVFGSYEEDGTNWYYLAADDVVVLS